MTIRSAGFDILLHPPYFPDLAPNSLHLFAKLKEHISATTLDDDDAVTAAP